MMKKVFLDTNILIDYLARRDVRHELARQVGGYHLHMKLVEAVL